MDMIKALTERKGQLEAAVDEAISRYHFLQGALSECVTYLNTVRKDMDDKFKELNEDGEIPELVETPTGLRLVPDEGDKK